MWVQSLVSFSGLRIRCYREPWCRSQTWLRSAMAGAVPWPRNFYMLQVWPSKEKKAWKFLDRLLGLDYTQSNSQDRDIFRYFLWHSLSKSNSSCCVALGTMSSHLGCSLIMWEKRMYPCMCNWVTMLYSRKLTEHSKPAIMEKVKIIIYKKYIAQLPTSMFDSIQKRKKHKNALVQVK